MKLLITGGKGQLATALALKTQGVFCDRTELDITHSAAIYQLCEKEQPDLIINTAAYTAVDKAEQESVLSFAVNREGAKCLAEVCEHTQIPLIHISTDYVFDGKNTQPYKEDDAVAPLNVYGQSKWEGEEAIRQLCSRHIILRVSGTFSAYGHNIAKTILRLAREKKPLRFVADQMTCPTPAADIAETILHIAHTCKQKQCWGTYHYCSSDPTSWYEFALTLIKHAALDTNLVTPIAMADYSTPAKRPAYSVLDCTKIMTEFSIKPRSWRAALDIFS